MTRAKHQKSKINPIVILICIFSIALFLIGYWIATSQAYAYNNSSHAQVIQTKNFEGNPDPNYATYEYWEKKFPGHSDCYIQSLTPGETISPRSDGMPYFINKDITVESKTNGQSALIIGANSEVTLIFEKCDNEHWPVLTVIGGDGFGQTPSGCGIEVKEGSTLIIKGRGTLNATSGNYVDDASSRAGEAGGNGLITEALIDKDVYSGTGGAGGAGGGGIAAAIGTKGSQGGQGAPQTKRIYSDDQTAEVDGNDGSDGNGSPNSLNSGNIYITGNMLVNAIAGTLGPSAIVEASAYGEYDEWAGFGWRPCGGGGGAGGSGGFPFLGCAIGTGGAGGAGGGAGGSGGVDYDGAFIDSEIYACNGGGGGAGFGSWPTRGFGGLANPYVCASDVEKAKDGTRSKRDDTGRGGDGTNMNNHDDDDDTKGGTGGNGAWSGYAGTPRIVYSSVLESRGVDVEGNQGRNAEIEEFYPNDECNIECVGGYVDPQTGIHAYAVKDSDKDASEPWYIPDFTRLHFPTGIILGDEIPVEQLSFNIIKEEQEGKYQLIEASYTQNGDISAVTLTTKYYVVKEIEITINSYEVEVSKVYDGTTAVHPQDVIKDEINFTVPEEYLGKITVKPEYVDFDDPDVKNEEKELKLVIEVRSGEQLEFPVYLSSNTVNATYKITKLYTDVAEVTIPQREYRPNNYNAVITDLKFKYGTEGSINLPESDYRIIESTIEGDSCGVGKHDVKCKIELLNATNASFGTESIHAQTIVKNSTIIISVAHIDLHSVVATNRAFEKDNMFVDAKTAYFINLPDSETFTYDTDYKIYVDNESEHPDQAKIKGANCDAGDHDISCKVKLLNTNYQFTDSTQEVETTSTVKITKKYIQLYNASVENRQFSFNDFDVEINNVEFNGLSEGEKLIREQDYTVPVAKISDEDVNVGTHNIAYQIELTDAVKNYTFGLNGSSAVGTSTVEISKREIGIDSVEFETVESASGDISVKVKNVHFSNLNEGVTFTENVDYVVKSCVIADGSTASGLHTVKYEIALINGNYTFSEGSNYNGEAQIEIVSPGSNTVTATSDTGDNGLFIYISIIFITLIATFALKRASKFSS